MHSPRLRHAILYFIILGLFYLGRYFKILNSWDPIIIDINADNLTLGVSTKHQLLRKPDFTKYNFKLSL